MPLTPFMLREWARAMVSDFVVYSLYNLIVLITVRWNHSGKQSPAYTDILLRLLSYLVFTRFAYASYLPYLYNRTVSTVYRTHLGLCHYLDT
jgi:hypothetical protein